MYTNPEFRQFWLENAGGERIGLNGEQQFIFLNPTGLGWDSNIEYASLKDGFFTPTSSHAPKQGSIVGDLVFHGENPYEQYKEFTKWAYAASELYLLYMPAPVIETYKRRVKLQYLTKSEKTKQNTLSIPVSFSALSPWYIEEQIINLELGVASNLHEFRVDADRVENTTSPNESRLSEKIYTSSGIIEPHGQINGSFTLTYFGRLINPVITIKGRTSGSIYGKCSLETVIGSNSGLWYSSNPQNSFVRGYSGNTWWNLINSVDLSEEPFPQLPFDESVLITLKAERPLTSSAIIKAQYYLKGV